MAGGAQHLPRGGGAGSNLAHRLIRHSFLIKILRPLWQILKQQLCHLFRGGQSELAALGKGAQGMAGQRALYEELWVFSAVTVI